MRRALSHNAAREVRGQTIFVFLLGLAMVAMILANVFLFMEYFQNFYGRNDLLDNAEEVVADSESRLQEFKSAGADEAAEPATSAE